VAGCYCRRVPWWGDAIKLQSASFRADCPPTSNRGGKSPSLFCSFERFALCWGCFVTPITTVRLPPALRAEAESYARSVGCSLNGLVGVALRDYLDARRVTAAVAASAVPPPAPVIEASPAPAAVARPVAKVRASGWQVPSGSVREPRFNDPCPCGSGKKYGKCHGAGKRHK